MEADTAIVEANPHGAVEEGNLRFLLRPETTRNYRPEDLDILPAPEPHARYHFYKRSLDIVLASVLIVLTAPIVAAAAGAILLTSGWPIFYRQRRLGYLGREFTCWKLRTMWRDAERQRDALAHLNVTAGPTFKHPADPRVLRVGRILRKTSIDELPQLWNVLRGDMSMVGPRPLAVSENIYTQEQAQRLSVKPGLTCFWQVSGRSEIRFERWMELDVDYVRQRNLGLDILLIAKTITAVLSRRGAV